MTSIEAAEAELHQAIRMVYVTIAHEQSWSIETCAQYIEELAAVVQLRPDGVGSWALTLEQSLGEAGPPKVRQALTQLAHASAILEALEVNAAE